jgi:hypothetical protein
MSTFITGALVVAGTIIFITLLIAINKKSKRKQTRALLNSFNHAGAIRGLSFSSQEILSNYVIGLDGLHRHLLVLYHGGTAVYTSLPLADIKNCIINKTSEPVDYGSEKKPHVEQELRSITLQFSFNKKMEDFFVEFYNSRINSIYELKELELKAKDWQLLLSKMLQKEMEVRA